MTALLDNLTLFTRTLRGLGLPLTPDDTARLARALGATGLTERRDVKNAAKAVLACRKEHLAVVDSVFDLFFRPGRVGEPIDLGEILERASRERRLEALVPAPGAASAAEGPAVEQEWVEVTRAASDRELLRRKDFAELTPSEAEMVARLLRQTPLTLAPRRTRRLVPGDGRSLDARRTLRKSLATGGEPLTLSWRRRKEKPRPLVVLLDVSGSMEPYARMLLQLAYTLTAATWRLEVFVFGTRLTRITRELARRDVDRALREAAAAVVDWGGGTRIGESLHRFNYDWGRRVLGRGAVVLLISDGWERGDPEMLEREMARLHRTCQRLIWLNPLLGRPGYEPLTRGMRSALPHVDDFLPVHDLESLEQLAAVLEGLK